MMNRRNVLVVIALLAAAVLSLPVAAQESGQAGGEAGGQIIDEIIQTEELSAQIVIDIPADGIGFNEDGDLLLFSTLSNIGTEASDPLDLIAIILTDCIVAEIPQTCRFAAFGSFEQVTPNGIMPGNTVQWTFNFGPHPQVDLSRWSVIWYQVR